MTRRHTPPFMTILQHIAVLSPSYCRSYDGEETEKQQRNDSHHSPPTGNKLDKSQMDAKRVPAKTASIQSDKLKKMYIKNIK